MRSGDVFYTDGIQLEEGEILHDYVDFNNPQIIGDCEISEAGTPDNPRYWKNIIPKDYTIYDRYGVSRENLIKTSGVGIMDWKLWGHLDDGNYWNQLSTPPIQYIGNVGGEDSLILESVTPMGGIAKISDKYPYNWVSGEMFTFSIWISSDNNITPEIEFNMIYDDGSGNDIIDSNTIIEYNIDSNWSKYEWTVVTDNNVSGGGIEIVIKNLPSTRLYFSNPILVIGDTTSEIDIDENSEQTWFNNYYYPVLPRLNRFGKFDEENLGIQNNNVPFGAKETWDSDDEFAPITNPIYQDPSLVIDLDFNELSNESMGDLSGNDNIGIVIGDYIVRYSEDKVPSLADDLITPVIKKDNKGKAF